MMTDAERDKIVKHLGKQLRAVVDVAVELEEVGDLVNAKDEAQRVAARAGEDRNQAVSDRDAALEELALLDEQVRAYRKEATSILPAATVKAQEIVSAAQVKAGGMIAVAQEKVAGMTKELDLLKQNHVKVTAKYADEEGKARDRVAVIQAELAALEKRLSG